ncbi:MarC family protein [Microvirga pudoricolor]|uniref:MarC family protein n=1 Tax=Microvirga pudoricolor TaxID=2778729 RepID=UPI00194E1F61|nr:MarC family protein [Microvirga pudoricolor]MBM6596283.1 MarC family protein [Microvirga pudoricolor]
MLDDQNLLATQFLTLWAMLDPISHLSLFLGATSELGAQERRRAALIGVPVAFCILVFFGLAGQALLHAMGISLISFQIAGGIILLVFSLHMVLGDPPAAKAALADRGGRAMDVAIYPLATPIVAGPGAMLAIIILTDNNRFTFEHQAVTLGVLAVVLSLLLAIFLLGEKIVGVIGQGGTNVLRRIMGVILAALSVNLILTAASQWLGLPEI